MQGVIQITNEGVIVNAVEDDLKRIATDFKRNRYALLRSFVAPGLLSTISSRVKQASFVERSDEDIATELTMKDDSTCGMFLFAVNNERLFSFIQAVTQCSEIGCFIGRVYRFLPNSTHFDSWHDDRLGRRRLIGFSLNLGDEIHCGGLLEIREKNSGRLLNQVRNAHFGDAIIFALSDDLEHRVTNVTGNVARTVFAGWFQSQPHIRELFAADPVNLPNV